MKISLLSKIQSENNATIGYIHNTDAAVNP